MEIRIRLPRISPGLVSNLIGVLGLVAIVVAVAGLTSIWWAILTGGTFCVALAILAGLGDAPAKVAPATGRANRAAARTLAEAAKAS